MKIGRISIVLYVFCLYTDNLRAQSALRQFKQLSGPERCWVLSHPFTAKKAARITRRVLAEVDSVKRLGGIGADLSGGMLDAFKHAYWMASLSHAIGKRRSLKLGKAHEKGNFRQFKKGDREDGQLPDSASCVMDLHNNKAGAGSVKKEEKLTARDLRLRVMLLLRSGELLVIRKDPEGNFLDCQGNRIDMKQYAGKWGNPKCLIASRFP